MKKTFYVLAAVLAAGCAVGAAGCGGSSKNIAAINSNWYSQTTVSGIQPTFISTHGNFKAEEIVYDVNFKRNVGGNFTYYVEYEKGEYTTAFYAEEFDAQTYAHEEFRAGFTSAGEPLVVYTYKTELKMPKVTFFCGLDKREFDDETLITECKFLSVSNILRPLYSYQYVKSATPATLQAVTVDDAYKLVDCEYKSYYNYEGTSVITEKTDNLSNGTKTVTRTDRLDGTANSLFDVAEMEILARALNLNEETFTQNASIYTPSGGVCNVTLGGGAVALPETSDEEKAQKATVVSELTRNQLYTQKYDEENNPLPLGTVAVNVLYNGTLSGLSQRYWYVAVENPRNNEGRATMVRLEMPVAYNLGTRIYTLREIEQTLWNS